MTTKVSITYMVMCVIFCTAIIVSNLFATKIIEIGPFTTTAALIVFPLSYIANDCVTEIWGYSKARFMIWLGFFITLAFIALSAIAVALPEAPYWQGKAAFDFIFGLAPRITIASLAAFLVGSMLNAFVMSRLKIAYQSKGFSFRAITSSIIGESFDSLVFYPIAFIGLLPVSELFNLMLFQVLMKTVYEIVALPLTKRLIRYIESYEKPLVCPSNALNNTI